LTPAGIASQSKAVTLSIIPPALSFCIHVILSLRIDLVNFFGSLALDMKFGCSVSKCDEKLNEGDPRKTLRESQGELSGKGSQTPPSHQPPARHSVPVVHALQKGGLPHPHNPWIESYRYKEEEEEGARGSAREREGVRGGARMTRTQSPWRIPLGPPSLPTPNVQEYVDSTLI